jgi:hypothetical protein
MEKQNCFPSLSLAAPSETKSSFLHDNYSYVSVLGEKATCCDSFDDLPAASVLPEYPFRLCDATDSFASLLGFKVNELKGNTLRLVFGPQTDLGKLKRIMPLGSDIEEGICLYRKDGEEMNCLIRCSPSKLADGESVSLITITDRPSTERGMH